MNIKIQSKKAKYHVYRPPPRGIVRDGRNKGRFPSMNYHLTPVSANAKTGPIPVTTSSKATCWKGCPFYGNVCYASTGPLALHWRKVSEGDRGGSFAELLEKIKAFPKGQLWRHNQAGDLPGEGSQIDAQMLAELVEANRGRKGFTYSHKPLTTANATLIAYANRNGFTVNVSANTLADADKVALRHPDLPICVVVPEGTPKRTTTPAGREVRLCPAEKKGSGINCANCKLCSKATRSYIIGFTVHGTSKKGYAAAVGQ